MNLVNSLLQPWFFVVVVVVKGVVFAVELIFVSVVIVIIEFAAIL